MWREGWSTAPAITFASAGFAAVAPDYLGLGLGPGTHPYLHLPSETTASVDLLRAARTFAAEKGWTLRREVFVTGFSHGASTEYCAAVLKESGVAAPIVDVGSHEYQGSAHLGSNVAGTVQAVRWFTELG